MFKKALIAATLVAATAATTVPAAANGQISFGISAQNQQEQDLITGGLALFQIANGADPAQVLTNVATGGDIGVVHQEGNGHNGSIAQGNGGNAAGLFQFGNNTNGSIAQNGGEGDLVFTFGW